MSVLWEIFSTWRSWDEKERTDNESLASIFIYIFEKIHYQFVLEGVLMRQHL